MNEDVISIIDYMLLKTLLKFKFVESHNVITNVKDNIDLAGSGVTTCNYVKFLTIC